MKKEIYCGLFLTTLATLSFEILLTRIFSVTLFYHFAFLAISIAVFGLTVGALFVGLFPSYFARQKLQDRLTLYSFFFSLSIVISVLLHYFVVQHGSKSWGFTSFNMLVTYLSISTSFVCSGICVTLLLTHSEKQVATVYALDMAGAAFGCLFLFLLLEITDGPTAVFFVGALAAFAALLFSKGTKLRLLQCSSFLILFLFSGVFVYNTILVQSNESLLQFTKLRNRKEPSASYEKWNSYSRIKIYQDNNPLPSGWGFSPEKRPTTAVDEMILRIDSGAGTHLTKFNGDLTQHRYLKFDATNIVHFLRPNSKVLIVGVGGGRDILSALVFKQKQVVGVEYNDDILKAVNGHFGDFTGHLDRLPNVTFVNDEARSYLARQEDKFDIVLASLIDTNAATAAGAYVLTENSLYTVEAWNQILEALEPHGVLSFSRQAMTRFPGQIYRMVGIAANALRKFGIEFPRKHIMVVRSPKGPRVHLSTILVSRAPFKEVDIKRIQKISGKFGFKIDLSPKHGGNTVYEKMTRKDAEQFYSKLPFDVSPTTDDRPFFFNYLDFGNVVSIIMKGRPATLKHPFVLLFTLFLIILALVIVVIILPLFVFGKRGALRGTGPLCCYFSAIGFGYMLVEIGLMQRLTIFLGHPIYGLTVILFVLLLGSALGSYFVGRLSHSFVSRFLFTGGTVVLIALVTIYFDLMQAELQHLGNMARILSAVILLVPIGFGMGMFLPFGMKSAFQTNEALTPWLWGINGATSVLASVAALIVSMTFGITICLWVGFLCYMSAFLIQSVFYKRFVASSE